MTHVAAYFIAFLVFGITNAILWFGRASIGASTPLLLTVVGGNLLALAIAAPAQLSSARAECVAWYRAWKSGGAP